MLFRSKVTTARTVFSCDLDEALGSRLLPLDDTGLRLKFDDLVSPVLSPARAASLADQLWDAEACPDVRGLVEAAAKSSG